MTDNVTLINKRGSVYRLSELGRCIFVKTPQGHFSHIIEPGKGETLSGIWAEIQEECR